MPYSPWKSELTLEELDTHLENAYRRLAGVIGFNLNQDRGNTNLLKDSASQALEAGLDTPGPWFLKLGRGVLELGGYRPAGGVSLKDVSAEVMREFFSEGNTAYQLAKAALYADAARYMREQGIAEHLSQSILKAADDSFVLPSKDAFTQVALPLIGEGPSPATVSALAGIGGFAITIVAVRAAVLGALVGVLAAGVVYYMARGRLRARAERLLHRLPKNLYSLLVTGLKSNARRYEDVVNAGLEKLGKESDGDITPDNQAG